MLFRSLSKHHVTVQNVRFVSDIMERNMDRVHPETPIAEIVKVIDLHKVHRVAVVDHQDKLLGMISDKDLFAKFSSHRVHLWSLLMSKVPILKSAKLYEEILKVSNAKTASDIMKKDLVTISEDAPIWEAIKRMTEHRLKRLPVIDDHGIFRGLISRDSVLRVDRKSVV